jgi:hypothetical protein
VKVMPSSFGHPYRPLTVAERHTRGSLGPMWIARGKGHEGDGLSVPLCLALAPVAGINGAMGPL